MATIRKPSSSPPRSRPSSGRNSRNRWSSTCSAIAATATTGAGDPQFPQPLMYKAIAAHPSTLEIYGNKLVGEGVVTAGEVDKMKADWRARLDVELEAAQSYRANKADWLD